VLIEGYASCRIIVLNLLIYKQVKFFQCFQDLRHVRRPSEASKDNLETGSTSNTLASSKHLSSSNNVDKDDDDDDDDVTEDESQHDDDR